MNEENIPAITDKEELYDKCENMEQLFDKYYLPLLDKHYSKVYELQQENKILKENAENNDKVVDKVNWENQLLKKEIHQLKEQLDRSEKARKEAIEYIKTKPLYEEEYDYDYDDELELLGINSEQAENDLLQILDIDKGE